jgi:hypothetical protein
MTSTLPLVTIAVVTFLFSDDFNFMKSSLNKNVTTARVTSGKVEVIIKQKRYYSNSY